MPQNASCAVLATSTPPMETLYCPVCDECRDHPQPFLDPDGRWLCGACWFETGTKSEMQIRVEEPAA